MISIYNTVSSRAEDFDGITFNRITATQTILHICEKIAQAEADGDHERKSQLKKKLPAVTWQAYQERGTQRSTENSMPNGLFILDFDHVDDPRALWERINKEKEQWAHDKIMVAHITPSGKGLRIVAKRYNTTMSIPDCQNTFCQHYGLENDAAVKDLSRLSFLVPRSYFLYLDTTVFDYQWEVSMVQQEQQKMGLGSLPTGSLPPTPPQGRGVMPPSEGYGQGMTPDFSNSSTNPRSGSAPLPLGGVGGGLTSFKGVPIKDLVSEVVERTGGMPEVGERNTRLYEIARILRYIVDFDANKLTAILPSFGLPTSEVAQVAQSAVKSGRSERIPDTLYNILKDFKENENEVDEEEENDSLTSQLSPLTSDDENNTLPPVFKEYVKVAPEDFKEPVVFSLLPILGTLASTARAQYLDGQYHSPSFLTVVTAPQASGKSFARGLVRTCLAPLMAEDMKARLDEQMYRKALREAKNSKAQPKEPETIVRCVPASISVAKLLKRLDAANGLHLFTFCEEIDTVAKSNSSGAWAQKSDIYRNAFDNATYGQDYMTDVSYSATLDVFYNLLLLGTPNAVGRFFKDPEDGLVSRVSFTQIPDQFGADMPVWGRLSKEESDEMVTTCRVLMEQHSKTAEKKYYNLDYVNDALNSWLLEQRDLAVVSMSRARDVARRRAAVVGFRAALLAVALNEVAQKEYKKEDIIWFAKYIADVHLSSMLALYGDLMERVLNRTSDTKNLKVGKTIFSDLPETFTRNELYAAMRKGGYATLPRKAIYIWKKQGLIEKINSNEFRKCKI